MSLVDANTADWHEYLTTDPVGRVVAHEADRHLQHTKMDLGHEVIDFREGDPEQALKEESLRSASPMLPYERVRLQLPPHANRLRTPRKQLPDTRWP